MKKMVIHCASGIRNSGDEAILSVLLKTYRQHFSITVISLNQSSTRRYHPGIHCLNNGSKECAAAIRDCDVFILGGGGLLQDETTIFNIRRWGKYLEIALRFHKKTMVYANSIGPLNYRISQRRVCSVLNRVDLITVRDPDSKRLLEEIGVHVPVEVTADPVFSFCCDDLPKEVAGFDPLPPLPEKYTCVSIRHWFDTIPYIPVSICTKLHLRSRKNIPKYERYVTEMARILDFCVQETKLPVVFVPFIPKRDVKPAEDILHRMNHKNACVALSAELHPYTVVHIIYNAEFLIGMRLHSLIYAIVAGTPFFAVSYSSKVRSILNYVGLDNYKMDIEALSLDKFKALFTAFDPTAVKLKLQQVAQSMRQNEQKNCLLLYSLAGGIEYGNGKPG